MTQIEHLLRETIGLDASTIGSTLIQRTVRLRMKHLGLKRVEDYKHLLGTSPKEWAELVETTVVTETWFFRDREPFDALVRLVLEEWLPAHPVRPLRLLSLPCSSGEEPYSTAMALVEAGVPTDRWQIDAVDISARALARAKRGIYGKNSFRGKELGFRALYFQHTKEGFVLSPTIRSRVHFFHGNLLGEDIQASRGLYDFIFCRNLLIYLDRPTQQKALEKVARLLAPAGVLFVGAAEQPLVIGQGFVSANIPMAFACRKPGSPGTPAAHPQHPIRPFKVPPPSRASRAVGGSPAQPGHGSELAKAGESRLAPPAHTVLERARQFADAGRLTEAAAICEAHLRENRASVQAWYLLGLVRDAGGDESAIDYYRKALYLEPDHYDSLQQMALLAQRNGDHARARTLKRRAERARNKT